MKNVRIIAFYLPQYYPTKTNNENYEVGFTEWTNVRKARPLFKGHYQPKVPTELGYYDLRDADVKERQVELAKEAGIEGFCYYHYWFGEGREELDLPLKQIIQHKRPDFPFCLCWANQSWYAKFWNKDVNPNEKLIIEQKYDNKDWRRKHFLSLLSVFKDERYIKVNGKLLYMIYRPLEYKEVGVFMEDWQRLSREYGLPGFYFIGQAINDMEISQILTLGFDGVNIVRKNEYKHLWRYNNSIIKYWNKMLRFLGYAPYHYDYKKIYHTFIQKDGLECKDNVFPSLLPNWDHSPRSGKRGEVFYNSTPALFRKHTEDALQVVKDKPDELKLLFLKSWNEWGEGNYMEPDIKYGRGYIHALRKALCLQL